MLEKGKKFWGSFPFLITTAAFAAAAAIQGVRFGAEGVLYCVLLFAFAVAIVAHTHRKGADLRYHYEIEQSRERGDRQLANAFAEAKAGYWFGKYLEVREDRAAFLKVLTAVFPAGYREEWYVLESPTVYEDYGIHQALQWFLYIDLPEEYGLPHRQLRLAVSESEMQIIGDLPVYSDQRITLLEADSRASMRQYLVVEAVNHVKEKEDGPAVPA